MKLSLCGFTFADGHNYLLAARGKQYVKDLKLLASERGTTIAASYRLARNHIDLVIEAFGLALLDEAVIAQRVAEGACTLDEVIGTSGRAIAAEDVPLNEDAGAFLEAARRLYESYWAGKDNDMFRPGLAIKFSSELLAAEVQVHFVHQSQANGSDAKG